MLENWMTLRWTALLARGVAGVAFGVLAMVWPDETVVVLVVLWGCWAVVDGVMAIGLAGGVQDTRSRTVLILLGVVSLVAAFFALVRPGVAATTVTWIIGLWLALRGLSEIFGAFGVTVAGGRWAMALSGVVDGVIGVLFLVNPGTAALSIAFVVGLCAFVWGVIIVGVSLVVRRATRGATTAATDPALG